MKPRVINVIEIVRGVINTPVSFIITDKADEAKIVEAAEHIFMNLARKNGCENENEALEECIFDNGNGYEVNIVWSEVYNYKFIQ